ncbi:MAG: ABC transporter permease [Puniceicoccales bacterium]|jgi:ABC-type transport system involved in multi-copper enzyme maturation permease subunit|nr:ABC transporter permease [Puniceicoccales bacterium]
MTDSLRRLRALALNTFAEALRQRFFAFLALLGAALAAAGSFLRVFNFGNTELKFVADFGFGAMFLFGSILAVVMTAQLFFSELDNRTALTLLARPVRRWEFFAGKFLGMWALLGVFTLALAGILGALLQMRAWELAATAPDASAAPYFNAGGLAVFALLQWLRLGVVAALTLLVCAVAQSFLYAVTVSALATLVCQLRGVAQSIPAATKDGSPALRAFVEYTGRAIPDLQMFDLGAPLALDPKGAPTGVALSAAGYGALYIPLLLALAVWLFWDREV